MGRWLLSSLRKFQRKRQIWKGNWASSKLGQVSDDHILPSSRNTAIQCDHQKLGQAVERSQDGFRISCRKVSDWRISGYGPRRGLSNPSRDGIREGQHARNGAPSATGMCQLLKIRACHLDAQNNSALAFPLDQAFRTIARLGGDVRRR